MAVILLPDLDMPEHLRARVSAGVEPVLLEHRSGRPWIVGTTERPIVEARTRDVHVAIVGDSGLTRRQLTDGARSASSVNELDALAAKVTDSGALFFAYDSRSMRSQSPLLLSSAVFWGVADSIPVISDDLEKLRHVLSAQLDVSVLASRLTDIELALPFSVNTIWDSITCLGPGEWLKTSVGQGPISVRWWQAPQPTESLPNLADPVRDALRRGMARRSSRHRTISADLSGGLDSTTLNFALGEVTDTHASLFLKSSDVANVDHLWADRAAGELGLDHHVEEHLDVVTGVLESELAVAERLPEGPTVTGLTIASALGVQRWAERIGSSLHLNGHGGDALFGPVSTMFWSLAHSRGSQRIRRLLHLRAANRYPIASTLGLLVQRGTFRDDLRRLASGGHRRESQFRNGSRWVGAPTVPNVMSGELTEHLTRLAQRAIDSDASPLSPDRTVNQILQYLVAHGNVVRGMNGLTGDTSLTFDSPFLDREVVEYALALKIGDRVKQSPAKPLLAAARPKAMALDYFLRRDKGDYTAEIFSQHRVVGEAALSLFRDGSVLEDLGLIDTGRLLASLDDFSIDGDPYADALNLAFAERWLRSRGTP